LFLLAGEDCSNPPTSDNTTRIVGKNICVKSAPSCSSNSKTQHPSFVVVFETNPVKETKPQEEEVKEVKAETLKPSTRVFISFFLSDL